MQVPGREGFAAPQQRIHHFNSTSSNPKSVTSPMPCTENQRDRNQTVPRAGSNVVRGVSAEGSVRPSRCVEDCPQICGLG